MLKTASREEDLEGPSGQFYNCLRPPKANLQAYDETGRERWGRPARRSAQYDPPINRAAYCPDALYVIDDLVGNGRRVGGRQDRLGITEADVIVAAASHEIAGRDRIGFVWIERRIADLDR